VTYAFLGQEARLGAGFHPIDERECYARAEECVARAKAEPNAESREGFLRWERRWLTMARAVDCLLDPSSIT
jgi:hypothetical protein